MNKKTIKTPHSKLSDQAVENNRDSDPNLIKRKEAARLLGVHPETVRRWQYKKLLPAIQFNSRTTRYRREDVLRLIAEATVGNLERPNQRKPVNAGTGEDKEQ